MKKIIFIAMIITVATLTIGCATNLSKTSMKKGLVTEKTTKIIDGIAYIITTVNFNDTRQIITTFDTEIAQDVISGLEYLFIVAMDGKSILSIKMLSSGECK